ncbi:hypothetical protein B566_EDAN017236 [Ephemera danica]|nr:hypothetical protein B566_EDAN017236 [Ephemera danica]
MSALDKIEKHTSALTAKTERLRLLRRHFDAYMARTYPDWKDHIKHTSEPVQNMETTQPKTFISPQPFTPPSKIKGVESMAKESEHFKSLMREKFHVSTPLEFKPSPVHHYSDFEPQTEFNTSRDLLSVTLDDDDHISDEKENQNPTKPEMSEDEDLIIKKLSRITSFDDDTNERPGTSMGVRHPVEQPTSSISIQPIEFAPEIYSDIDFEHPIRDDYVGKLEYPEVSHPICDYIPNKPDYVSNDYEAPEPLHRPVAQNLAFHRSDLYQPQPHHLNYIHPEEEHVEPTRDYTPEKDESLQREIHDMVDEKQEKEDEISDANISYPESSGEKPNQYYTEGNGTIIEEEEPGQIERESIEFKNRHQENDAGQYQKSNMELQQNLSELSQVKREYHQYSDEHPHEEYPHTDDRRPEQYSDRQHKEESSHMPLHRDDVQFREGMPAEQHYREDIPSEHHYREQVLAEPAEYRENLPPEHQYREQMLPEHQYREQIPLEHHYREQIPPEHPQYRKQNQQEHPQFRDQIPSEHQQYRGVSQDQIPPEHVQYRDQIQREHSQFRDQIPPEHQEYQDRVPLEHAEYREEIPLAQVPHLNPQNMEHIPPEDQQFREQIPLEHQSRDHIPLEHQSRDQIPLEHQQYREEIPLEQYREQIPSDHQQYQEHIPPEHQSSDQIPLEHQQYREQVPSEHQYREQIPLEPQYREQIPPEQYQEQMPLDHQQFQDQVPLEHQQHSEQISPEHQQYREQIPPEHQQYQEQNPLEHQFREQIPSEHQQYQEQIPPEQYREQIPTEQEYSQYSDHPQYSEQPEEYQQYADNTQEYPKENISQRHEHMPENQYRHPEEYQYEHHENIPHEDTRSDIIQPQEEQHLSDLQPHGEQVSHQEHKDGMYGGVESSEETPDVPAGSAGFKEMELQPHPTVEADVDTLAELDSSDMTATVSEAKSSSSTSSNSSKTLTRTPSRSDSRPTSASSRSKPPSPAAKAGARFAAAAKKK